MVSNIFLSIFLSILNFFGYFWGWEEEINCKLIIFKLENSKFNLMENCICCFPSQKFVSLLLLYVSEHSKYLEEKYVGVQKSVLNWERGRWEGGGREPGREL